MLIARFGDLTMPSSHPMRQQCRMLMRSARHVARQIERHESGQALENVVDRELGY